MGWNVFVFSVDTSVYDKKTIIIPIKITTRIMNTLDRPIDELFVWYEKR